MDTYTYTYDSSHNQLSKTETINGVAKGTTYFTYDKLNRLKTVQEPDALLKTTTYQFDGARNRTVEHIDTTDGTVFVSETMYNYNTDKRLTGTVKTLADSTIVTTTYVNDNNGNQVYSSSVIVKPTSYNDNLRYTLYPGGASEDAAVGTAYNVYDVWNQLISVDNSVGIQ